jgi:phage head maturation protease
MAEVHKKISLADSNNEDKFRDATVMGDPGDEANEVSLWVDSVGLGFRVTLAPAQAREIAAALIEAAGPVTP